MILRPRVVPVIYGLMQDAHPRSRGLPYSSRTVLPQPTILRQITYCMPTTTRAVVNRTYGTHKNLYPGIFFLFLLLLITTFGLIYYGPP